MQKRVTRKQLDKEFEQVEAMAQDGKAGVEATKQILTIDTAEKKEELQREVDFLSGKRRFTKIEYNKALASLLYSRLYEDEFPEFWVVDIKPDNIGVVMEVVAPNGRKFKQAFKASGVPEFDLSAVEVFALRMETTVERYYARSKAAAGVN